MNQNARWNSEMYQSLCLMGKQWKWRDKYLCFKVWNLNKRAVFKATHMCLYTMQIERLYTVYNYFNNWNTNEFTLNYSYISSLPSTSLLNEWATTGGRAACYGLDGPGIESWWGWYFPHPSRPAPEPMRPPVKWVPGVFLRGSSRGVELTTRPI